MNIYLQMLPILVACLFLSFFFSGMEAGVFALNRLRVRQLMRAGNSSARLLHGYLENPENFLWTILVGNTVVNFVILGVLAAALHEALGGRRIFFTLAFLAVVFFFYAFCDLLPKMLFRLYPNRLCLALARPFRFAHIALRALVAFVEWCSGIARRLSGGKASTGLLFGNRDEFRLIMQESAQVFTSEERAMINRVLDLQTLKAGQLAAPLAQVVTVRADAPLGDALQLCRERGLTRLPVWETRDGRRRIIGLINLDALLFLSDLDPNKNTSDFLKPAIYVDEDMRLESVLRKLQRGGQRLAIVLARGGHEIGIIGLQDILKTIFGEVHL